MLGCVGPMGENALKALAYDVANLLVTSEC